MRKLAGKRALVTGAASGIGREIALRLAREHVDLYLLDFNQEGLQDVVDEVAELGVEVEAHVCDLRNQDEVEGAAEFAIDYWAGVDILVNNAGVTYYGITHLMPPEECHNLLATNLVSGITLTQRLLPWMLARPQSHVLNVCSVLGLVGLPRVALYCTTKFAMVGYSEALRAEYGRQGLGVTALCPGFVRTNLFSSARPMAEGAEPRTPPSFMCAKPECVARRAVRAIERNQRRVVLEPFARLAYGVKSMAPGLLDWALRLGEQKKIAGKRQRLAELSSDPTEALRLAVGNQAMPRAYEPPASRAA
ncbi:putative ketoacyl reductase [Posidoniimonas polymericola]|uniref:Putative ketoacyl reductase n=1 Tax=Posidoniimonas polymericola TaxID=2528002 RepID=A0A5C5YLY8_9BACT|nr:SDR family oxidoreductase [Posidoniimonas polymericola]TWT75934.1 putative ketoacyl reductase [Posidoniimonas polymericola]